MDDHTFFKKNNIKLDNLVKKPMKPKVNRKGDTVKSSGYDRCQTPAYALAPLLPYLRCEWLIWESACGEKQNLVKAFGSLDRPCYGTDLLNGDEFNFFSYTPEFFDCSVTNPPYSVKYKWLARCYEIGKPFALLMPVEMLGAVTAQNLFKKYGIEIILLSKRVNFDMPNKGYDGHGAQFPVAWYTWKLGLGRELNYGEINYEITLEEMAEL